MLIMLTAAALVLSNADKSDLRCYWATMKALKQVQNSDANSGFFGMLNWYGGRFSGRHPDLRIGDPAFGEFAVEGQNAKDADLKACFETFADWQNRQF